MASKPRQLVDHIIKTGASQPWVLKFSPFSLYCRKTFHAVNITAEAKRKRY
jgi:hypothetical protein